jgi:hypothetical protein
MSENVGDYARHFQEGVRVRVGVPIADGGNLQEWGVVRSLSEDLLELSLVREALPQQAVLKLGEVIDLRLVDPEGVRHCRGMVAGETSGTHLMLRLVDGVVLFEAREFYRQDVYLPLDYRLPPDQDPVRVRERWRNRIWAQEFAAQAPELDESRQLEPLREQIRREQAAKKAAPPVAANISGGGVRLNVFQRFRIGMLIDLTLHLPEQRLIEVVGEVVQLRPLPDESRFSTALSFRFIEEADRDRLIAYISSQQLSQLSQHAPRWPEPGGVEGGRRRSWAGAIIIALLAGFMGCQMHAILARKASGEKHEIQRMFDEGVGNYLKQRR